MQQDEFVRIDKIVVKIGDRSIELSPTEARAMRDELQNLLGPATPAIVLPPTPWPGSPVPIYVNPNTEPFPDKWTVTWGPLGQANSLTINV